MLAPQPPANRLLACLISLISTRLAGLHSSLNLSDLRSDRPVVQCLTLDEILDPSLVLVWKCRVSCDRIYLI
jgi:hypothetical protein